MSEEKISPELMHRILSQMLVDLHLVHFALHDPDLKQHTGDAITKLTLLALKIKARRGSDDKS